MGKGRKRKLNSLQPINTDDLRPSKHHKSDRRSKERHPPKVQPTQLLIPPLTVIIQKEEKKLAVNFTGNGDEVDAFCVALDVRFSKLRMEYGERGAHERIISLASEAFKKDALRWWGTVLQSSSPPQTLEDLKMALVGRFGALLSNTGVMEELADRKNAQRGGRSSKFFCRKDKSNWDEGKAVRKRPCPTQCLY